jgi:hypothetical protein
MSDKYLKLMSDAIKDSTASIKHLKKTYGKILLRNSLETIFKNAGLTKEDVEDAARRMR